MPRFVATIMHQEHEHFCRTLNHVNFMLRCVEAQVHPEASAFAEAVVDQMPRCEAGDHPGDTQSGAHDQPNLRGLDVVSPGPLHLTLRW